MSNKRNPQGNLNLWLSVEKTNPAHTRKAPSKFGKTINTIDAMHQIRNVTEQFGPVGSKWSYTVEYDYPTLGNIMMVIAKVTVTTVHGSFGPVAGARAMINLDAPKAKTNDDAPKMALTDGLTKAISHLGFNADVFLGKFDDNKYEDNKSW